MVLRLDFSTLREEEFDIEYEFTHEHGTGVVRFANEIRDLPRRVGQAIDAAAQRRENVPIPSRTWSSSCIWNRVAREKDYVVE